MFPASLHAIAVLVATAALSKSFVALGNRDGTEGALETFCDDPEFFGVAQSQVTFLANACGVSVVDGQLKTTTGTALCFGKCRTTAVAFYHHVNARYFDSDECEKEAELHDKLRAQAQLLPGGMNTCPCNDPAVKDEYEENVWTVYAECQVMPEPEAFKRDESGYVDRLKDMLCKDSCQRLAGEVKKIEDLIDNTASLQTMMDCGSFIKTSELQGEMRFVRGLLAKWHECGPGRPSEASFVQHHSG